jgi:hypothetical protein
VRTDAIPAPQQNSQREKRRPKGGEEKGEQRGKMHRAAGLRVGARCPSGRPGTRWLRVDRKPLSTEHPGPTRVAPAGQPEPSAPVPRALDLAPSGGVPVRYTTPWPSGVRRLRGEWQAGRPVVDLAEPTRPRASPVNSHATCGVSPNQQVSAAEAAQGRRVERPSSGRRGRAYITHSDPRGSCVPPPPSADRPGVGHRASVAAVRR